jgi:phage terminase large subunit-like protein
VEQHPGLDERCKVNRHESRIDFPENRSYYRALAHDTRGSHGFNIHGLVVDEFHTWRDGELYRSLDHGTASREQPLTIVITTAGVFDPESECYKLYDYARKVRDGIIDDPSFLPVIYEAPPDADWRDPEVWRTANPGLGVTVSERYLEMKAREAENMPSEVLSFRQLHLNQWPEQLEGWLPMDRWKMCGALDMDEDDLTGRKAWLGVDLASTRDLTAVAVVIPLDDGTVAVPMRFFCPDETIVQRSREDHVQYDRWAREGWIRKTEGSATDYGEVRKEIHRLATKYDVQEIAVDPWNAQDLNGRLISDGFDVIQVPQTARHVSHPAKELEKLVAEGRLRHGENPVLTWCASNATVRSDSNENIKPDKKRSKEKIDGIVAVVNGLARALVRPKRTKWLLSQGDAS